LEIQVRQKFLALWILFGLSAAITAAPIDDLQNGFLKPPADCRIMMRWWWFGPAVTTPELEREMRLMKEGVSAASRCSPSTL
jgi:hypothetical protein